MSLYLRVTSTHKTDRPHRVHWDMQKSLGGSSENFRESPNASNLKTAISSENNALSPKRTQSKLTRP